MARRSPQPESTSQQVLECLQKNCPSCGKPIWNEYDNYRQVRTLEGVVGLRLKIRRCQNLSCERYRIAYRPEQEGKWALPQQEFGLDVIALVGALRYQEHRSVPQIHHTTLLARRLCEPAHKKELKKQVRGIRGIERSVSDSDDPVAQAVHGYCLGVRSTGWLIESFVDSGQTSFFTSGSKDHLMLRILS